MHKRIRISDGVKNLQIRIFKKALILTVVSVLISLFIKDPYITTGIIAGFFIGVIHFKMLSSSAETLTGFKRSNWIMAFSILGVFSRFLILGILFWFAIIKSTHFFVGTVIGFFTIKASVLLESTNRKLLWKI